MAARQYTRPAFPLPDLGADTPRAGLQVVAQPVDMIRAPRPYDAGHEIAQALAGINPALNQYLKNGQDEKNVGNLEAGQRARAMQDSNAPVAMTPEQDPYWQRGYMQMHGQMMGIQDSAGWDQEYQDRKTEFVQNPSAFQQWITEKKQASLAGMTDQDALHSYLPQLVGTENKLRRDLAVSNVEFAREQKNTAFATTLSKAWTDSRDQSIPDSVTSRDAMLDGAFSQGLPRKDAMKMYVSAALADQYASPSDLQALFAPGKDGVIPAYVADANGNTYEPHIRAAMARAQQRMDADLSEKQVQNNVEMSIREQDIITHGTVSRDIPDVEGYIRDMGQKGGLYHDPGAARAAYVRLTKAVAEEGYTAQARAAVNGLSPMPYAQANSELVKPLINDQYEKTWASVDWSKPETFQQAMQRSTQMFEQWGVPDPYIKKMAENAQFMGTVTGPDGKEALSPQMRVAYSLWKGLRDSNNPQLQTFSKEAQTFLHVYDAGLQAQMPELEAFRRAKLVNTPEAQARVKSMFSSAQEEAGQLKSVSDYLNSSIRLNDNGWWPKVGNSEDIARSVMDDAKARYALGGITSKDAISAARDSVLSSYVYDGYRSAARIPADMPRERAKDYLSMMADDAKAAYTAQYPGQTLDHYSIQTKTIDGKTTFTYRDPTGLVPLLTRNTDELEQQWLKKQALDPESIAARQQAQPTPQPTNPTFGEIGQSRNDLNAKLLRGEIKPSEYRQALRGLDDHLTAVVQSTAAGKFGTAGVPTIAPPNLANPAMKDTVPGPVGVELSPKAVAQKFGSTDPTFALGAYGEGFRNVVYPDSNGKRTIGIGYNLDARSPEQVQADLRAAGVTDPARIERVVSGKEGITPDEASRLYSRVRPAYEKLAKEAVGESVWNNLPDNRRAVLADLAYQTGNIEQFKHGLAKLQSGESEQAIQDLQVHIRDPKTQQLRLDLRRNTLRQAMWESKDRFLQLVSTGA